MRWITVCLSGLLACVLMLGAPSRSLAQDQAADRVSNVYTTHDEHVTVERTTTTISETTTVHVVKKNYKCAIFVENRSDKISDKKVLELQDLMTGYATDKGFNILAREDVMNNVAAMGGPNAGDANAPGHNLDALLSNNTSAVRLAQNMGVDYLLVCTITSYGTDKQSYRDPSQGINLITLKHQLRTTFKLLDVANGGSEVAGVAVATITDRIDPNNGSIDRENLVDDLLDASAMDMADMLAHDARGGQIAGPSAVAANDAHFKVEATVANLNIPVVVRRDDGQYEVTGSEYHPEVLAATVEVDGVVVGTTPGPFTASPGLHKMRVRRDLFEDWQGTVNIRNDMKLTIAMQLTDRGLQEYQGLSHLFEHLKAHAILTDAEAKVLEGKATELSHSAIRVDIGQTGSAAMGFHDDVTGGRIWTNTTTQPAR